MNDEIRRAIEGLHRRLDSQRGDINQDRRDGGAWRDYWAAELDGLIAEVRILQAALRQLEDRLMSNNDEIERATTTASDMVSAGMERHMRAITKRVRALLAADRKTILKELDDLKTQVGAVALELANSTIEARNQRIELLEGVRGLSQHLSDYEQRLLALERGNGQR